MPPKKARAKAGDNFITPVKPVPKGWGKPPKRTMKEARLFRFYLRCRRMFPHLCPVNKKLEYRLYYRFRTHETRSRQLARQKLERLGLVRKGDGAQVHHIDGDPMNNSLSNLRVVTHCQHRKIENKECDASKYT